MELLASIAADAKLLPTRAIPVKKPIVKKPIAKKTIAKKPIAKKPIAKKPIAKETIVYQTNAISPLIESLVIAYFEEFSKRVGCTKNGSKSIADLQFNLSHSIKYAITQRIRFRGKVFPTAYILSKMFDGAIKNIKRGETVKVGTCTLNSTHLSGLKQICEWLWTP